MSRGERPGDLPAPYLNPWGLLARDLVAVVASLRLEIWQLWRRNRQGLLPRPRLWPAALAGWFWPLLVALLLLVSALAVRLLPLRQGPSTPPSAAETPVLPQPAALEPEPAPAVAVPLPAEPESEPEPESPAPAPLPPELTERDPLALIRLLRPSPALGVLELELDSRFAEQPSARRQELAEAWAAGAEALGFEQLRLVDGRGALLGRRARVGSGMILFASPVAS